MCSVPDDEGALEMTPVAADDFVKSDVKCRKCNQQPVEVILRQTDPYCRDCFLAFATHKFRSCIGKHKALPAGCSAVVGVSGGLASSALLHLVYKGITLTSLKKLRLEPVFLHIDEHCSPVGNMEDLSVAEKACGAVLELGLPCYYTTLETIFSEQPVVPVPFTSGCSIKKLRDEVSSSQLEAKLRHLMDSCASLTAKESVWRVLVQRCLVTSTAALGHSRLLLGSCASAIAADILSFMAQGRGAHISQHVSFRSVESESGVEVFRPLRELQQDELLHYNRLMGVSFVDSPHDNRTVSGCTHNFLSGLQSGFPSTVPTVFRTGDKLLAYDYKDSLASSLSDLSVGSSIQNSHISLGNSASHASLQPPPSFEKKYCGFCRSVLDTNQPEASAMHATIVSQRLSKAHFSPTDDLRDPNASVLINDSTTTCNGTTSAINLRDNSSNCEDNGTHQQSKGDSTGPFVEKIEVNKEDLISVLCYGCRISLFSIEDISVLPPGLQQKVVAAAQERRSCAAQL